jgi:ribonuclease E
MPAETGVEAEDEAETTAVAERSDRPEGAPGEGRGRRRRSRRRRSRGGEPQGEAPMRAAEPASEPAVEAAEDESAPMGGEPQAPGAGGEPGHEGGRRSRRRGRRGGRRRSKRHDRPGFEGGEGAPGTPELAGADGDPDADAAPGGGESPAHEPYELSDLARGHEPMPAEPGLPAEPQANGPAENGADRLRHGGHEPTGHEPAEHEAERTADSDAAPASGNGGFAPPTEPEPQPAAAPGGEAAEKDTARKGWLSRFLD